MRLTIVTTDVAIFWHVARLGIYDPLHLVYFCYTVHVGTEKSKTSIPSTCYEYNYYKIFKMATNN